MNNLPDWNLLRSLLAVVDHGSLLGAAQALGISQPTVSRQMTDLSAQLGVVLFERTGRGLHATATALKLAQLARPMEAAAASVATLARGSEQEKMGTVRISASQPMACHLLPPLLARMRMLLPQVRVQLVVTNAISNLLRREADIALRLVNPQQSDLIARRIGQVRISAYAHRDYLQRRGMPREPADLAFHDLIGGDASSEVLQGLNNGGVAIRAEDFVLRTDDLVAYGQALAAGVGIGFVCDYQARAEPALLPVLPELKIPALPLWLVVHRELRTNPHIRQTFDFLAQEVPKAL
jgi:DNA-binding transcriptional LysR family regulator